MSTISWSRTTPEAAARRAGGRRRYNAARTIEMRMRRYLVAHMLRDFGMEWGAQTRMAEEFGVSRSTAAGPESKRRRHETRMSHLRYATHAGGVAEGRPVGAGVVEVVGGTETAPA